ncbi:putative Holliday junction resolvase [Scopulibacillus darangshiensis]|uniref:Putative pre-16S rRNA nuclease n=1 Tax=Scopulibacillus darangshiensis TaxID=442528 RepID=A0A4V2SNR8_9BACL|nr:Holliday junction resolvase RuvX [Scopulibacillus darangshiensis]TCP32286.1 putative Holliday junction resolvase [Scopulibacillus darangshiensis]
MRIMALDYGTKTVGVAISDALGLTAQGIETINYQEHTQHLIFERLSELIEEYDIHKVVVGLPKHMNGDVGERGKASTAFANKINKKYDLPVDLWDERLTTMAAEKMLITADVSRKKRKKVIDKMAAVIILQSYLDRNGIGG